MGREWGGREESGTLRCGPGGKRWGRGRRPARAGAPRGRARAALAVSPPSARGLPGACEEYRWACPWSAARPVRRRSLPLDRATQPQGRLGLSSGWVAAAAARTAKGPPLARCAGGEPPAPCSAAACPWRPGAGAGGGTSFGLVAARAGLLDASVSFPPAAPLSPLLGSYRPVRLKREWPFVNGSRVTRVT